MQSFATVPTLNVSYKTMVVLENLETNTRTNTTLSSIEGKTFSILFVTTTMDLSWLINLALQLAQEHKWNNITSVSSVILFSATISSISTSSWTKPTSTIMILCRVIEEAPNRTWSETFTPCCVIPWCLRMFTIVSKNEGLSLSRMLHDSNNKDIRSNRTKRISTRPTYLSDFVWCLGLVVLLTPPLLRYSACSLLGVCYNNLEIITKN